MTKIDNGSRRYSPICKALKWLVVGVLGTLVVILVQYMLGILRKPKHYPRFIALDHRSDFDTVEKGYLMLAGLAHSGV